MQNLCRVRIIQIILALMITMTIVGCGGESAGSGSTDPGEATTSLDMIITAVKKQQVVNSSHSMSAMAGNSVDGTLMLGEMLVENIDASTQETHNWSVYLNQNTFEVESNKTIILTPGNYRFSLLLTYGDKQYAGLSTQSIADGENTIDMTIRPVIGDTVTNVSLVAELADFKFQYDPSEIAAASIINPNMGVIIDGGLEEILAINPATGISDDYLNLPTGTHTIELKLYDGSLQKGKSLTNQQTVVINPGWDIAMDLVALHGEVTFSIDETSDTATFHFTVPSEVVDEASGLAYLETNLSIVGPKNPLREEPLTVTYDGSSDYEASITLPGFQHDDVTISLAFFDSEPTTSELLGSCSQTTTIDAIPRNLVCDLTLRRRAVAGGNLLGTVGFSITESGVPVEGASVYANSNLLGITGSTGYLKTYLSTGNYLFRAESIVTYGETSSDIIPLSITPITIELDTPIPSGFVINQISNHTAEDGSNAVFYVKLDTAPLENVVIDVSSDNVFEGITNLSSMTFTPSNWDTPQAVIVTGVDDSTADGNVPYNVALTLSSSGADYAGVDPDDLSFTNVDLNEIPNWRKLPDTGQTTCYDTTGDSIPCPAPEQPFAQDGSYPKNTLSYTIHGNGTVIDNNTKLMWQQQDDDLTRTWDEAVTYCQNLELAGLSDWRLPGIKELKNIVNHEGFDASDDSSVFPGTNSQSFWSSSIWSGDVIYSWILRSFDGAISINLKSLSNHVRCVRGQHKSTLELSDFAVVGNGTIEHKTTGLTWQQEDDNVQRTWVEAIAYCENLTLGSHDNWRLPNINELQSVIDYSQDSPATFLSIFPNVNKVGQWWSSTTRINAATSALYLYFASGFSHSDYKYNNSYVLCVRN